MKFKKNIISNLALQITTIIMGFFTSILLARGLGTENQGQFSYYTLIFGIIAGYGGIAITSSMSYFIKKTDFDKQDIINTNISALLILSTIYVIAIILFKHIIFSNNIYILMIIWLIYAISLLFSNFFVTIYVAEENIYVYNKYFILIYILKSLLIIGLYYINMLNIFNLSILYAILEVVRLVILLKILKIKYKFSINKKIIIEELKYGMPLYLAGLFIYLNYRVDQIYVRQTLGNSQLGIYSIAVHLADLAFIFPDSIKSAFEGKLYSCRKEERKHISAQIIKFAFYITLIICIIGILCKPLVTILYGSEYEQSGGLMVILLLGISFVAIGKVAPAYFCTDGRTKIHLKVSGMVLIINIILNSIFVPRIGVNGAAIASTIAYIVYGVTYIILLKKDGITIKELLIPKKEDFYIIKDIILKKIKS
ncbi:MAG: oligosaccharide flippase family protein [Clostridia bacterium]